MQFALYTLCLGCVPREGVPVLSANLSRELFVVPAFIHPLGSARHVPDPHNSYNKLNPKAGVQITGNQSLNY